MFYTRIQRNACLYNYILTLKCLIDVFGLQVAISECLSHRTITETQHHNEVCLE